ncbi:unnamed protein product [Paramecium sonneborni]|uniref:Uncharacterized protein n=1 Tax=Paramecium sonneborni TaxID=65129 RepID=A0A8S1RC70_9CILI|nr:unnamed protein product [Paramecium sonneborni]
MLNKVFILKQYKQYRKYFSGFSSEIQNSKFLYISLLINHINYNIVLTLIKRLLFYFEWESIQFDRSQN